MVFVDALGTVHSEADVMQGRGSRITVMLDLAFVVDDFSNARLNE
eukprot:CAMPEP_0175085480 /NCGR_PEP_ID=MMETSP0052_2-20121109/28686_1 /TAXON_ID=51329 ORGANISM="Polytomella parva, Strain SAG 63-3" /NCGR_SAMPLE_ID=MMETSP0052_2 /ASSEMBLY_ACC=CAM_ASM_000194 /LENGTH=44 /DNA_ID= /DNA_START= /DNA_END= /DNA_ORIENTATION=